MKPTNPWSSRTIPLPRPPVALMVAGLFIGLLSGCSTRWVSSPTATVRQVRIVEQSTEGVKLHVTVDLKNPNSVPLPLVDANYRLQIADAASMTLHDEPNKTLPAGGTQTLELPAAIKSDQARLAGAAYRVEGSVRYQTPGEARRMFTDSGVPLPKVAFQGTGKVE